MGYRERKPIIIRCPICRDVYEKDDMVQDPMRNGKVVCFMCAQEDEESLDYDADYEEHYGRV